MVRRPLSTAIVALLLRRPAGDVPTPATSTVHAVLDRYGLVSQARKRNRANKAVGTALSTGRSQRPVVRRFQGRVQARRRPILLPPDNHRPGIALSAVLRSLRDDPRTRRFRCLRAGLRRTRPAACHPLRQRPAIRQPEWALQSLQAVGLVAQARHRRRTHPPRPSAGERPP